jgi:hypothetical protein
MRLNKTERESLRKRVEIVIPQMKKSEIVNHFEKEGYPGRTIYNTINRLHNGEPIKDKKQTGRRTFRTSTRNNQLKRLTNNRKGVSQRRLGRKFGVYQMTICRQLSKMNISCFKREKTSKYTEKQAEKQRICDKNLLTYYTDRHVA